MDETVTLQTLVLFGAPAGVLLLLALFAIVLGGPLNSTWRRLLGRPTRSAELEQRVIALETAIKRARASELPLEIEAERFAEEVEQLEAQRRGTKRAKVAAMSEPPRTVVRSPNELEPRTTGDSEAATEVVTEAEAEATAESAQAAVVDLPPDPIESDEDRIAREQLEAEEQERIQELAAEEARIRQEREEAEERTRLRIEAETQRRLAEQEERDRIERERIEEEERIERERIEAEEKQRAEEERIERERLEAEAQQKREEEQRRKAEEFRRRVAEATPKIVMSAGGSNREGVTINVEVTNNLTPKRAELTVLSATWSHDASSAPFETQRKDGLYEEFWPKHARTDSAPSWGTYEDASGRVFECPEDEPTEHHAWIVISYERTAGGPASTWQRFEVGGAGALWFIRQPIGDPVVIETKRDEDEAAA